MPIAYDAKRGGLHFTRETVQLPGLQMGTAEMLALMVSRRIIEAQREPGIAQLVSSAIDKLSINMGRTLAEECKAMDSVISFRQTKRTLRNESDPNIFPVLVAASYRSQEVELHYLNADASEPRPRRIRPLHLFLLDDRWYLFCQDCEKNLVIRRMLLTRMSRIQCTGKPFKRPKNFDVEKELANSVGIYGGGDPQRVRLRLYDVASRYLAEEPLHASQKIAPAEDGTSELTIDVSITPELEGIILRWGWKIEVLEPLSLRETVLKSAQMIVARG